MYRLISCLLITVLWLALAGCNDDHQPTGNTASGNGDGETADLIRRLRKQPGAEELPAELAAQRDEVIEAATTFLSLLLDDDPKAHQKYMLSDTEVKQYFDTEKVEKYVLPGRATILAQTRVQMRNWAGSHEPRIGDVQVEALAAPKDSEPARAGRILVPFRSGVTRIRLSIEGAVKTSDGWQFMHFVVSRPRR